MKKIISLTIASLTLSFMPVAAAGQDNPLKNLTEKLFAEDEGEKMTPEELAEEERLQAEDAALKRGALMEVEFEEGLMLSFIDGDLPESLELSYNNFYRLIDGLDAEQNGREVIMADLNFATTAMYLAKIQERFIECRRNEGLKGYYGQLKIQRFEDPKRPDIDQTFAAMEAALADLKSDGQITFKEAMNFEITSLPLYTGGLKPLEWEKIDLVSREAAAYIMTWNDIEPYKPDSDIPTEELYQFALWVDAKLKCGPENDPMGATALPLRQKKIAGNKVEPRLEAFGLGK